MYNNDIPTIKLFIVGSLYYYYDAKTNNIFGISKQVFAELHTLIKLGIHKYKNIKKLSDEYNDVLMLIEQGYISCLNIEFMSHQNNSEIQNTIDRCISNIELQVTRDCNMNCRYCLYTRPIDVGRNHEHSFMTWDTAKKSLDFLYHHSNDVNEISIYYYGGEPLMNFDVIKRSIEYASQKFCVKHVKNVLITNGILLNDEIIKYIIKNDVVLIISFDGPKDIQNDHRRFLENGGETYDYVLKKINRIKELDNRYYAENVKFNAVSLWDENVYTVIDYFDRVLGKRGPLLNIINPQLNGIDYIYSDKMNSNENVANYLTKNDIHKKYSDFVHVLSDKTPIGSEWRFSASCVPGIQRLFVNTMGDFYPCEKVAEIPINSIGNLKKGISKKSVTNLANIHNRFEKECKSCWAIRFCDMCVCHYVDETTGEYSEQIMKDNCTKMKKKTADNFRKYIVTLQEKGEY